MKRMFALATVAGAMLVFGLSSDTEAARRCRPTRRNCVGVTHQPCATAAVRAPKTDSAATTTTECICAVWQYASFFGYNSYYALDFYPDCSTYTVTSIDGIFTVGSNCPACPASSCLLITHNTSRTPGPQFKPGTKLDEKMKWNEKLALKSGQGKFKSTSGAERTFEFESKELADASMLVSFTHANTQYYAKLHTVRVEAQELGGAKTSTVSDFAIGQEIDAPPAGQKIRDVSSQVTVLDTNVATIKVGNANYQVVTMTPFERN